MVEQINLTGGLDALNNYMAYLSSPEYKEASLTGLKRQLGEQRSQMAEDLAKFNLRGGEVAAPLTQLAGRQVEALGTVEAGLEKERLGLGLEAAKMQTELAQWQASFGFQQEQAAVAQAQWERQFAFQGEQAAISQQQWQSQFNWNQQSWLTSTYGAGAVMDASGNVTINGQPVTTLTQQQMAFSQQQTNLSTLLGLYNAGVDVTGQLTTALGELGAGFENIDLTDSFNYNQAMRTLDLINMAGDAVAPSVRRAALTPILEKLIPGYTQGGTGTGADIMEPGQIDASDKPYYVQQQMQEVGTEVEMFQNYTTNYMTQLVQAEGATKGIGSTMKSVNAFLNQLDNGVDRFTANNPEPFADANKAKKDLALANAILADMPTAAWGSTDWNTDWAVWLEKHNIASFNYTYSYGVRRVKNFRTLNDIAEWK